MTGNKRKRGHGPIDTEEIGTVSVVLDHKTEAPFCPHGPTVLFKRESRDGTDSKCFYACAAHRDRKGCDFFMWQNLKVSQAKKVEWKKESSKNVAPLTTLEDVLKVKKGEEEEIDEFYFCHTCSKLMAGPKVGHVGHTVTPKLSKLDLANPTK
jgi:hypothetical protein